jgi:hypothetical protein
MRAGLPIKLPLWACALLVLLTVAAPSANAQKDPRLPTELWNTYPLDPTNGETNPATGGGAHSAETTEKSPNTARGGHASVGEGRPNASASETSRERQAIILAGAAALGGLAALLLITGPGRSALGRVKARRWFRLSAKGGKTREAVAPNSVIEAETARDTAGAGDLEQAEPLHVQSMSNGPPRKWDHAGPVKPPKKRLRARSALPPGKTSQADDPTTPQRKNPRRSPPHKR